MERQWKLNQDLCENDNILDPITFEEVITTVQCNCREKNLENVIKEARKILDMRLRDFYDLLALNAKDILKKSN